MNKNIIIILISILIIIYFRKMNEEENKPKIKVYQNIKDLTKEVVKEINELIKTKPRSIIVLPTGSTPIQIYKEMIKEFKKDLSINYSETIFFNLDEYIGLEKNHPLSYNYYMEYYLYGPLKRADIKRAPKNYYIPRVKKNEEPKEGAIRYENLIKGYTKNDTIDLVILGVGGAFPDENGVGIKKNKKSKRRTYRI
jgi:glucosamine-6-phosphate deaminase